MLVPGNPATSQSGQRTHFALKAKRVILIFLEGGLSQMDSFDPKPELLRRNGSLIPHADGSQPIVRLIFRDT